MQIRLPRATSCRFSRSSGTSVGLTDNTAVGRNSQSVSVNGARTTQNNFEINGIDANRLDNNSSAAIAVPAPETIQEFKVQTSLYDATFGRGAGGSVLAVTRSGGNQFHGALYEYFRDNALNANNPFLKAAGVDRPVLKRNVFGGLIGGPSKGTELSSSPRTRARESATARRTAASRPASARNQSTSQDSRQFQLGFKFIFEPC